MPNWTQTTHFCRICRQWQGSIHLYCPFGGGSVWFDTQSFFMGCGACKQMWNAVSGSYFCNFGHLQLVEFVRLPVNIEAGDEVLHTDGQIIYVLKQVGVLIIGYYKPIDRPETFEYFNRQQNQSQNAPPMPEAESPAPEELIETQYMQILQLTENYSVEEIKRNRKRLLAENHPDKVMHMGKTIQDTAKEEKLKIDEAYSYFKNKLKFE